MNVRPGLTVGGKGAMQQMARTWLSIRVDLVSGRGEDMWPRPGRVFAAARSHTFAQLARAIDLAFARWDLAHMHMFTLADGTEITRLAQWDGDAPDGSLDDSLKLRRLTGGDQFAYVFDFGDDWTHLCTVDPERIDPLDTVGIIPPAPTAYWGWGHIPDQYDRRFYGDDGETEPPKLPKRPLAELPPILPWWDPNDGDLSPHQSIDAGLLNNSLSKFDNRPRAPRLLRGCDR